MVHTFREALAPDAIDYVKILIEYFDETHWLPDSHDLGECSNMERWSCEHFQDEMAWVSENEDVIIGFCSRKRSNNNISAAYVKPEWRNQGVGKQLLDLAKAGCNHIIVWAFELNNDARNYYHRAGLVEFNRGIDENFNIVDIEYHWTRFQS